MQAQQQALEARIAEFDVVITTAAVPGRAAPKIIPASAVRAMRPGSVIVDLAADTGGNCELTRARRGRRARRRDARRPDEPAERRCRTTRRCSTRATCRRCSLHLAPGGELDLDWDDEITAGACVDGKKEGVAA